MAPTGVMAQIPPETFQEIPGSRPLSLRKVADALGVDPREVTAATVYGMPVDGQQGAGPCWEFRLTTPAPGGDATIGLYLAALAAVPQPALPGGPVASGRTGQTGGLEILARMDVAWNACLQIEVQLAAVAKQLTGMMGRLNGLNRDLSSEEFRLADQQDKREWQEARRWLRDIVNRVARVLKDFTVGLTSDAGRRSGYEALYKQHVVPRRPGEGLEQAERDFEMYRKSLQTLLNHMVAVHGTASQDGERRAQMILGRIAAKVRSTRAKR